jgi:hypothetical protein
MASAVLLIETERPYPHQATALTGGEFLRLGMRPLRYFQYCSTLQRKTTLKTVHVRGIKRALANTYRDVTEHHTAPVIASVSILPRGLSISRV